MLETKIKRQREEEEEDEKVGNADKMVKHQTSAGDFKEAIMQHSAAQRSAAEQTKRSLTSSSFIFACRLVDGCQLISLPFPSSLLPLLLYSSPVSRVVLSAPSCCCCACTGTGISSTHHYTPSTCVRVCVCVHTTAIACYSLSLSAVL